MKEIINYTSIVTLTFIVTILFYKKKKSFIIYLSPLFFKKDTDALSFVLKQFMGKTLNQAGFNMGYPLSYVNVTAVYLWKQQLVLFRKPSGTTRITPEFVANIAALRLDVPIKKRKKLTNRHVH